MVDYRGPEIFRSIAHRFGFPLCHRVVAIQCRVSDIADANIDRQIINEFKQLEDVTFTLPNQKTLSKLEKTKLESSVPACRVSSVVDAGATLIVTTTNGPFVTSCSDQHTSK